MDLIEFTERYFGVEFTEYQKDYIRKLDEKGRNNMTETKTHLIADESIGGIEREYIEVGRDVEIGDYVIIKVMAGEIAQEIRKVEVLSNCFDGDFYLDRKVYGEVYVEGDVDKFSVLEPTNIVHIDGTRYQLAERKAEVGEKVFVFGQHAGANGIRTVEKVEDSGHIYYELGRFGRMYGGYYVLIPVDSEPAEPTPDIHDLLANLAQRVTSLERITGELVRAKSSLESQLRDTQNNVQTFAEQTEANTKDIKFLDDRTFKKPGKPTKSAEEILREISKILERDERQ